MSVLYLGKLNHFTNLERHYFCCEVTAVGHSLAYFSSYESIILLMAEILHQLIGNLSHYLQGLIQPRWCRISAINSISDSYDIGKLKKENDSNISRSCVVSGYSVQKLPCNMNACSF